MEDGGDLLKELCDLWLSKIRIAMDHKKHLFQNDADTAFRFFNGPHDFMYTDDSVESMPAPAFKMTTNKVAEFVQIFGPAMYSNNPVRKVTARPPLALPFEVFGDPNMAQAYTFQDEQRHKFDQIRAALIQLYLNWSPSVTNLRSEARQYVDEALIKGRGCLWTEIWQPTGANFKVSGSFYDTVDNLATDPDMESMDQCFWIARRCVHPKWHVERQYGLKPGSIKGNCESIASITDDDMYERDGYKRRSGGSNDLLRYWKIYSRMGMGTRLSGASKTYGNSLEMWGDYVYIVVAEGVPFPLNLPPELQAAPGAAGSNPEVQKKILMNLQWPIPTYAHGTWPVTVLDFHKVPRQQWPMSHLKPAMGELKFLNWAYSFLAGKIRNTSRDFVVVMKEAAEEIKTILLTGQDMTMIELENTYEDIRKVVQFLQHPEFNGSIWQVIAAVNENFEKRVGLNELSYGNTGKQIRSAAEAEIKSTHTSTRPDDMAEQVEAALTEASRKEALAARYLLRGQDVQRVLGEIGAEFWDQFVATSSVQEAAHEFEYRIEAGSARKPNKQADIANFQQAMQVLLPVFQSLAQSTGNVGPINALIKQWCQSLDIEPGPFMIVLAPPQPPGPPQPGQPPGPGQSPAGGPPGHPGPPQGHPQPQPQQAPQGPPR